MKLPSGLSLDKIPIPSRLQPLFAKLGIRLGAAGEGSAASSPQRTLACDFGASKILLLEVEKASDGPVVRNIRKFHRLDDVQQNAEAIAREINEGGFECRQIRLSIKGQGVVVRFIQFPQMQEAELRSALSYEAESYIPFKLNEVVIDFHIIDEHLKGKTGEEMNILLVAVKRDEIDRLIAPFQQAGLAVEFVDIDVIASINALEAFYPEDIQKSIAVLDLGKEISSLSVLRAGKPRFLRDISYGAVDLIKRMRRKLGMTEEAAYKALESGEFAEEGAEQVLKDAYGNLVNDLKVTLDYYLDQVPLAQPIEKLIVGGAGVFRETLTGILSEGLNVPVDCLDLTEKVKVGPGVDEKLYRESTGQLNVAMGLCLRP